MTKKRITDMKVVPKTYAFKNVCWRDGKILYMMQMIETRLGYFMITQYSGG